MQADQTASCACAPRCSDAAFVGIEGYRANGSIGELNRNDIKPTAYEEYLFVRSGWIPVLCAPVESWLSLCVLTNHRANIYRI